MYVEHWGRDWRQPAWLPGCPCLALHTFKFLYLQGVRTKQAGLEKQMLTGVSHHVGTPLETEELPEEQGWVLRSGVLMLKTLMTRI